MDVAIIGAGTGAGMAAIYWVFEKVRQKITGETPREPLTRDEMIEGLQAMVDDPSTSPDDRQRAIDRLQSFESLNHS